MTTDIEALSAPRAAATAGFIGQATAVEQSRAIAEVQAAVFVAQQCPRDVQAALREMRDVCRIKSLAERAFYSYRKAGSTIEGPSIHLARELARIWGNVQYGITELRRDNERGESEMQAVAWDLQTNTRSAQIFVVPHRRDKGSGTSKEQVPILDLAGVYENNANMGGRRLRAAVFSILPAWFKDEAVDLCNATLRDGGGKPLPQRIAEVIAWFADRFDVSEEQLAANRGNPSAKWTDRDVAALGVLGKSLNNGEIRKDEAFPSTSAGAAAADEIANQTRTARPPAGVNPNTGEFDASVESGFAEGGAR